MFAAFVFALGFTPAGGAELPTAEVLRAQIAIATGKRPASFEERRHSVDAGLNGTTISLRSGDDYREVDGDGPLHTEAGEYHQQPWKQNANGQTVLEQADSGDDEGVVYTTTVTRVTAPIDAYVISRMNATGIGTREFVDPKTDRVVRREFVSPSSTTTYSYDDFRTVEGYTTAWHWTRRDGRRENDGETWVDSFVARPVADAELRIPDPRRALVEFPAGKKSIDLPVSVVDDQFIVHVTVNGHRLELVLDSGAHGIFLDEDVAKRLGIGVIRLTENSANAGNIHVGTAVIPEMLVGDLRMRDVVAQTTTPLGGLVNGGRFNGVLGFDFIAELVLGLDYEHAKLTALRATQTHLVAGDNAYVLDIRLQGPYTSASINGAVGERFEIDTGDAGALMITDYFARRHPKALVDEGGGAGLDTQFYGVGGAITLQPYQLADVQIGKLHFKDFVGYRFANRKQFAGNFDGLIGAKLLRYFTVWLDYGNSQVILVPNTNARRAR